MLVQQTDIRRWFRALTPFLDERMRRLIAAAESEAIAYGGVCALFQATRMVAKAYRVADAVRVVGVPVVMGGPHVTEVPGEALGQDGGPRHANAVALGEADDTWPRIVGDAATRTAE